MKKQFFITPLHYFLGLGEQQCSGGNRSKLVFLLFCVFLFTRDNGIHLIILLLTGYYLALFIAYIDTGQLKSTSSHGLVPYPFSTQLRPFIHLSVFIFQSINQKWNNLKAFTLYTLLVTSLFKVRLLRPRPHKN